MIHYSSIIYRRNTNKRRDFDLKEIKKHNLEKLLDKEVLRNTHRGYVNKKGNPVGYHNTVNKTYMEDYYVDLADRI